MTAPAAAPRLEHDLLGDRLVPAHAYFGVHTLRATENFAISGAPISSHPDLIVALACVKQAAALANRDLGLLSAEKATVIVAACERSVLAACTRTSSSTSSRAAPAPPPT